MCFLNEVNHSWDF